MILVLFTYILSPSAWCVIYTFYTQNMARIMQQIVSAFSFLLVVNFLVYFVPVCRGQHVIKQVAGVGDKLTLDCYPPRNQMELHWEWRRIRKPAELLVNISSQSPAEIITSSRFSYEYYEPRNMTHSSLILYVMNSGIADSGNYTCLFISPSLVLEEVVKYDITVIGCSCFRRVPKNMKHKLVWCNLTGYNAPRSQRRPTQVELNNRWTIIGQIVDNQLVFTVDRKRNVRIVKFSPWQDVSSQVSCILNMSGTLISTPMPGVTSTRQVKPSSSLWNSNKDLITETSHGKPNMTHLLLVVAIAVTFGILLIIILVVCCVLCKCRVKDKRSREHKRKTDTGRRLRDDDQSAHYKEVQSKATGHASFRSIDTDTSRYDRIPGTVCKNAGISQLKSKLGTSGKRGKDNSGRLERVAKEQSEKDLTREEDEDGYLVPIFRESSEIHVTSKDEDAFGRHNTREVSFLKDNDGYMCPLPTLFENSKGIRIVDDNNFYDSVI